MKVKIEQYAVVLEAESEWERKALKKLQKNEVKRVVFTDAWEQTGDLRLEFATEDEYWGR